MKLRLVGHDDRYALEQLQLALFPLEPMEPVEECISGDGATVKLYRGETWLTAVAVICRGGQRSRASGRLLASRETVRLRRRLLQQCYYRAALPFLEQKPVWGALAGVRPSKLTTGYLLQGDGPKQAAAKLEQIYFVTPERAKLCVEASQATVRAAGDLEPGDVSVYVGIPFCPTRCAYCSFVSASISGAGKLLEPYLEGLMQEIRLVGRLLESSGVKVRTLYIGGGTPTTLEARQLAALMEELNRSLDLSRCLEYTVEAGRPDTVTPERLAALYDGGARRVSINPQSMDNRVLERAGRRHRAEEIPVAFQMARQAGFQAINMDLIAGLPGDTPQGFARSLQAVTELGPENITVHTLALKKAADLYAHPEQLPGAQEVAQMVDDAGQTLRSLGYGPYYLYRQKYMSGSFENVGWSQPGTDCLYNIYMMEELHSIVALGGGGVSKVNLPGGRLQRFPNPKYPQQYIQRIADVLEQKRALFRLLAGQERV